ncbi:MAG: tRNA pseudouridine(38-40) synthase TruA [Actinotalea sp.]|nr:tRNA pseudouridine(38-40) synthase TruA [Actinotalea sp.]
MRVRLDLSYDGGPFSGWALQPGLRTIQGVLEEALALLVRRPIRVTVAGRTDAGVHARGQVAHLELERDVFDGVTGRMPGTPGEALVRRLAGLLPPDVVVHLAAPAPPGFDARFSALRRRYRYRLADGPPLVDPLRRSHVVRHRLALDSDAMHQAALPLVGRHDFLSFCRPRPGATTIRTLERLDVARPTSGADSGLVVAEVEADAFCHTMVRALVGTLLVVGEGRRPVTWPAELLAGRRRGGGATVAPAHGLTLEEIVYPADDALAARASTTRARRDADGVSGALPGVPSRDPVPVQGPVR